MRHYSLERRLILTNSHSFFRENKLKGASGNLTPRKNNFRCDLSSLSSLYESVPCKWDVRCCSHERELVSAGSRSLFRRIHFLKKFRGNNFRSKPSLYMSQCMGRALLFPRAGVGFDRLPLTFSNEWALSEANFSGEKNLFRVTYPNS